MTHRSPPEAVAHGRDWDGPSRHRRYRRRLRVEAAPLGHGVQFSPGIERGNLPPAFIAATEQGVRNGVRQGLHGWEVTDCVVTMTASAYYPLQSKPHQKFDKSISTVAGDFRRLAPVVLMAALR